MKESRKKLVFDACYSATKNEQIPIKHRIVLAQACEALYEKEKEKMPEGLYNEINALIIRYSLNKR